MRWGARRVSLACTLNKPRLPEEARRLAEIDAIVQRTDPGPGGFYDDLGNLAGQPHLVRDNDYDRDPMFMRSTLVGFGIRGRSGF